MSDTVEQAEGLPAQGGNQEDSSPEQVSSGQVLSSGGHLFTVKTAAEACRVAEITIRRGLDAGKFPNAQKQMIEGGGGTERWVIPLTDLFDAGYTPNQPSPPDIDLTIAQTNPQAEGEGPSGSTHEQGSEQAEIDRLRAELDDQRRQVAENDARARVAEAIAAERERTISDLRDTLAFERRAITAGPAVAESVPMPAPQVADETPAPEPKHKSIWPWKN